MRDNTKHKTSYPGVRFREHLTRKHGIQKDKYFFIRYKLEGKDKEEGIGWSSEGWTIKKAAALRSELMENARTGSGPTSLKEKREIEQARKDEERKAQERAEKEGITFSEFFTNQYTPIAKTDKKLESFRKEEGHFKNWLEPVLGELPIKDIMPLHIERVKKNMLDAEISPRTLQYCLATFRQCWNLAKRDGVVSGDHPAKFVKKPKVNNERIRFFTHEQAGALLDYLKPRSEQLYQMSLLSLHTGMRFGEIANLKWSCINISDGFIEIFDGKGDQDRKAFITNQVSELFLNMDICRPNELVFKNRNGGKIEQVSNAFSRAIEKLGFNDGISDKRQRLSFHSLRHTFASWHAMGGTDLYTLQRLMGHSDIKMTQRYAHLCPDHLKAATAAFDKMLEDKKPEPGNSDAVLRRIK